MNLTITGPRSIGKTTISKLVAKKLNLKYISSDEIGENALKKQGGLDKVTKSGAITKLIKSKGYPLIKQVYNKNNNFVFDLSGGAFTSNKTPLATLEARELAKKKSIVIGLLPSKSILSSISYLYKREKKRKHFKELNKLAVLKNTLKSYLRFPKIYRECANIVIFTKGKSPDELAREIIGKIVI